jgi:hypothetical protein
VVHPLRQSLERYQFSSPVGVFHGHLMVSAMGSVAAGSGPAARRIAMDRDHCSRRRAGRVEVGAQRDVNAARGRCALAQRSLRFVRVTEGPGITRTAPRARAYDPTMQGPA